MTEDELVPDWATHPGDVLSTLLRKRDIRQNELAERTGMSAKHVNQIIKRSVGVSAEVAVLLGRALDTSPRFWTTLDADFQASAKEKASREELATYIPWVRQFDASVLKRHRIIKNSDDPVDKVEKVLTFFGVSNPDAFEKSRMEPQASFRRSQSFRVETPNTALWLRLVEIKAANVPTQSFSPSKARKAAKELRSMTMLDLVDGFLAARAELAEAGVALAFVPQVPGTRVNAVTLWNGDKPMIGLTERNRAKDIFWFNMAHEIGHVVLHPKRHTFLDLEEDKVKPSPAEREADEFAQTTLLPEDANAIIQAATTRADLALIASRLGVSMYVVAGRYGHLTKNWRLVGKDRVSISDEELAELDSV